MTGQPRPWRRLAACGYLVAAMVPATASGQVLTTLEFSFSNPGARSMGFGGAFVALADDATAAFANPAGLVQLTRPEVSLEGRFWSYSSPYTTGGRASGAPTGLGIDTAAEAIRVDSEADLSGLSFVSVVYPGERWSFAVFRHQLQNFEITQEIQGLFTRGSVAGAWRGPIERGSFDFKVVTQAVAFAYRLGDRLSLGVGLSHFQPHSGFAGLEYLPDEDTVEAYFAPASFLPERLLETAEVSSMGNDLGFAAGFLWKPEPRWSVGGAYREGPTFEFRAELVAGPAHPEMAAGTRILRDNGPWSFPDVYSLGVAYRSRDGRWTASCEWSGVQYSTIWDSLDPRLRSPGDILEDADELHLGGEYAFFLGRSVMALRLGAWHDPDHQVRNETGHGLWSAETPGGSDELHLAAGLGVAVEQLQVDLGIDLSRLRDTASLSLIYSF